MSRRDELRSTIEHAEYAAADDAHLSWISPVAVERSQDELVQLVNEYGDVDDQDTYRIGDIGCGGGALTRTLATTYPDTAVVGTDLSAKHAMLNMYDVDNTTVIGGDMYDVLPELEPFNFGYAVNVLQATDSPRDTLSLLRDSIRDDGYLVVTVPAGDARDVFPSKTHGYDEDQDLPYVRMDLVVEGRTFDVKQYTFSEDRITDLFDDAGFSVQEQRVLDADKQAVMQLLDALDCVERPGDSADLPEPQTYCYILDSPF